MIREALLTPNPYSRPQLKMRRYDCIVLHWVENQQSTAEANRQYFESLANQVPQPGRKLTKASAHYIIDAHEIVRCIPEAEVAYHVGQPAGLPYTSWAASKWRGEHPNWYCLALEHCHPDMTGEFESPVLQRSQLLSAGLCLDYSLDPMEAIVLHYTITGKACPRYFVEHPEALARYRDAVVEILAAGL